MTAKREGIRWNSAYFLQSAWAEGMRRRLWREAGEIESEAARLADDEIIRRFYPADVDEMQYTPEEEGRIIKLQRRLTREYEDALRTTERHLWALAIAGLYHFWEQLVKRLLIQYRDRHLLAATVDDIEHGDFRALVRWLKALGYDAASIAEWEEVKLARLIANTIKHGGGASFELLIRVRPNLLAVRKGRSARKPRPDDLVVGLKEFDQLAIGFGRFWIEGSRQAPELG